MALKCGIVFQAYATDLKREVTYGKEKKKKKEGTLTLKEVGAAQMYTLANMVSKLQNNYIETPPECLNCISQGGKEDRLKCLVLLGQLR